MVLVEDFLKAIPLPTKAATALGVKLLPAALLTRFYAHDGDPDDVATVIFSSGSSGIPRSRPRSSGTG